MKLQYLLGTSKTLNTCDSRIRCNKVKDITMNYQQETKNSHTEGGLSLMHLWWCMDLFGILRDYTWRVIQNSKLFGWFWYSPAFCTINLFNKISISIFNNKLIDVRLNKLTFKKDLSINHNNRYSTNGNKLDPMWVTGFVDAEGCFSIIIEISEPLKWKVRTSFEINLHEKDADILYKIQSFFGVGAIYNRPDRKKSVYRVTNVNYLNEVIIPHFTKYPLVSKKGIDFLLWSKVIKMILNKDHLTKSGFSTILTYYASINRGVSKKVLKYYPEIISIDKPVINLPGSLNPQWVSGFVAGDGGFSIYIRSAKDYILGEKVYCRFHIAQHSKDVELMKLFIKFFNCGVVHLRSNSATPRCDFIVQDVSSLLDKIIPHFDLYPLLNLKQKDYICFKECMLMIKSKKHLTQGGLDKIKAFNLEMNSNRLK